MREGTAKERSRAKTSSRIINAFDLSSDETHSVASGTLVVAGAGSIALTCLLHVDRGMRKE